MTNVAVISTPPPIVPLGTIPPTQHPVPTPAEQEHIQRALEASQTALDAIDSLVGLSGFVLTILGIVIGLIAIFGWAVIYAGARGQAKRVANTRIDRYIKSEEFGAGITKRLDDLLEARWQNFIAGKTLNTEGEDDAGDADKPFDER